MEGEDKYVNVKVGSPPEAKLRKEDAREKQSPVCHKPERAVRRTPAKQQKVQQQVSEEGSGGVEESVGVSPKLATWIKHNAQDLKIRQTDRRWAAEIVNDFRENLLKFLRGNSELFQAADFLTTGSYFEGVKIHNADEFDMMLKLQAPNRLVMTKLDGGLFYRLDLERPTKNPMQALLLDDSLTISSTKIMTEMFRLVRKFLKTYKVPDGCCRWEVNRKRPNSPAVTLSLLGTETHGDELISVDVVPSLEVHPTQGWPLAVRNGPDVDNWLGKKGRREITNLPIFFVPKRLKGRNVGDEAKESWRISFSLIEKKMITIHGNTKTCCESNATKCCRKQCLMLLKSLIEGLKQRFPKELEDLCSYHGKTAFLHMLSKRYNDSMWAPHLLPVRFMDLLGELENHTRRADLPHFFVPTCNLFSAAVFPNKALKFLASALEGQRRENLPLLKPPGPPAPSLRPVTLSAEACTELHDSLTVENPQQTAFTYKLFLTFAAAALLAFFVSYFLNK